MKYILTFKAKKISATHIMLSVNWPKTKMKHKLDGRDPGPASVATTLSSIERLLYAWVQRFATPAIFTK